MANRRMFSRRLVNSAKFLKMPTSSQCLYFHLGLEADDDGVVEAFNVLNSTGCTEDDLRVLVAKGYVKVLNEDLVTYITDWRENNTIRADRKVDSIYKDLLVSMVESVELIERKERSDVKKSAENRENLEDGQPMDGPWTVHGQPMDRIGKVRLGKDRIGQDRIGKDRVGQVDCQQIVDLYNDTCVSFPRVVSLSESRKKAIKARIKSGYRPIDFQTAFEMAEESRFLKGGNDRNWTATFDWMIKDSNLAKILEGNYANRTSGKKEKELDEFYGIAKDWAESEGTNG